MRTTLVNCPDLSNTLPDYLSVTVIRFDMTEAFDAILYLSTSVSVLCCKRAFNLQLLVIEGQIAREVQFTVKCP